MAINTSPVALVTGGSRGIGAGICRALGRTGFAVVVNYVGNQEAASDVAAAIESEAGRSPGSPGTAVVCQADVGLAEDRDRLVEFTLSRFERLDLLVNNAGVAPGERQDLLDATEASWDRVLGINLKGPFFLSQRVAREMIRLLEQGVVERPKIININSISGYASTPQRGDYCVAKAGLHMLTHLFADRLARHGIGVFEVCPGIIETDMTASVREKYDRRIAEGLLPLGRWGTAEDVARAVEAIAGDAFPYSTGETINVDGGFHMRRL
jgi:NAD(P)-dependent dehydrogenase (short-subunit alcohol dehydrogenase family)